VSLSPFESESTPLFQVVSEASDGVEAAETAIALLPDVVLLDMGMPHLNGIEAAGKIRRACPESRSFS
jgi:DNA-binding NarL/FixJ family response regulator